MTTATAASSHLPAESAAYRDAVQCAVIGARPTPNRWGGWDFEIAGRKQQTTLRLMPTGADPVYEIDGTWTHGAEIYVLLGRGQINERQAKVGRLSPESVAEIAAALLRG